uniref:Uncharacterized protein n=1 Tax=Panagrolaimus davidi TaxID=227884 RepID=A0A914PW68_9BILA
MITKGTSATFKSQDCKVSDKADEKGKLEAWNKSADLCSHTFTFNDKAEEKAKKKWMKDVNSSTLSLHISAYENEITELDSFDGENVGLKKNKINMDKQFLSPSIIQNPFEFPRQQEKDQVNKPELMGFRANQRLLGPDQSTSSNTARISSVMGGCI